MTADRRGSAPTLWPAPAPMQWLGWTIPGGYTPDRLGSCRGCHQLVAWLTSPLGRPSPHDRDGVSHFATCPEADRFRRRRR